MKTLRRYRLKINVLMTALVSVWQIGQPLRAADITWTAGSNSNFNWANAANWSAGVPSVTDSVFFINPPPNPGSLPLPGVITLGAGSAAGSLSFKDNYTLNGGSLTLGAAGVRVDMAQFVTINSLLTGTSGFVKTGGGAVRLGNNGNTYTGLTSISNGSVIITNESALGLSTSDIEVVGSGSRGFGGGSLILEGGYESGITMMRNLILSGRGTTTDRSAALLAVGSHTLAGTVTGGFNSQNTALNSANGLLSLTGPVVINGTSGTTFTAFGVVNSAGSGSYAITGTLSGTGSIEKTGGGTLFLNPTDASGFNGTVRVGGGSIRIGQFSSLGINAGTGTSGPIDLNGGTLEMRIGTVDGATTASGKVVYHRGGSSVLYADHAVGSSAINGSYSFTGFTFEDNLTTTLNSRNGYGMTFANAAVNGGDNNTTITNNLSGLLTYTGNFWSNANNTGNRTLSIGGNGNTLITGNIVASAADFNHSLSKSGTGTLTITSTGSTLDGNVNISGGTLAITDFRSITNNSSTINIGSGTTAATLSIIGNNLLLANLTTNKVINLNGTTGGATILANQTGTSPGVILNADFTATGGTSANAKTLTLGGTNLGANTINGVIPNNAATGLVNLSKVDAGTWILGGSNQFTGTTTIANGTLRLRANAALSTILHDTSGVTFNVVNNYAGGTLEFIGQAGINNVEYVGTLTPTQGANTIKLSPGAGGSASLVFASLSGVVGASGVNIVGSSGGSTVTLTGVADGLVSPTIYMDGSHFAYAQGGVLRAPNYAVDTGFISSSTNLTDGLNNEIVASFNTNSATINTLRINGGHTLSLNASQTLIVRNGGTNSVGGILATGGTSEITGGTGIHSGGSGALAIRVNGATDVLTLSTPITSGSTGGFTKNGAGTLILTAANNQSGTISINEGTVQLAGSGRLSAGNAAVTIRQGAILDLNGVTPATASGSWNNNGILTNSSSTPVTFTVGSTSGTGTSFGAFQETNGVINIVKAGSGNMTWNGISNHTGVTTIASTGIITVGSLGNIGVASGIGAGSAANNAGSLVFSGASGTQAYGGLAYTGRDSISIDRLFTFGGTAASSGARIQASGAQGGALIFNNFGSLAFASPNIAQGLVLGGTNTSDNLFNPRITDNGTAQVSLYKADSGLWVLGNGSNSYTGPTTLTNGILRAVSGSTLPTASNLVLSGGFFETNGTFNRTLGTGSNQFRFAASSASTAKFAGGFSGGDSKLTVDWGSSPIWGSTANFLDTRDGLLLSSAVAISEVELTNDFSLGTASGVAATPTISTSSGSASITVTTGTTNGLIVGQAISGTNIPAGSYITAITSATAFTISANASASGTGIAATISASGMRSIRVDDNSATFADFATLSGDISGNASTGIRKLGGGTLQLFGNNTYTGETNVWQGTLVTRSLGNSATPGQATSVGLSTNANLPAASITLGNGATGAAILQYAGTGETSDRLIRLNSTGTNQIHADGTGPLVLTNLLNEFSGAKTLALRGSNTAGNMITSPLIDNGGALAITIDGGATWVLTNSGNNYTGATTVAAGALGIGHNQAIGTGPLIISNASIFAYGADRTITNEVRHNNNTGVAFIGDYSLNFTNTYAMQATSNNPSTTTNGIVAGKTLTLGNVTANAITAARTWTINGTGDTIIAGNITTSTAFNLNLAYSGTGSLTLGGSNNQLNAGTVTVSSGRLKIGANNALASATTGNITLNPAANVTATLDVFGSADTIRGLTANSAGTAVIDNSSANAASLSFGNGDQAVTFVGNVTNTGAGALSLTKIGTAAASFTGGSYAHKGATVVTGGSLTLAGDVTQTSALSVTGAGSLLALRGGLNGATISSVTVDGGSTLTLLNGAGSQITNLNSLSLGAGGTGTVTLNLNIGDSLAAGDGLATDTFRLLAGGTLALGNTITFNLTDAGLNPNQTYTLLNLVDGGLSAYGLNKLLQGSTPGGYSSYNWIVTDNVVQLQVGNLVTGSLYWRGQTNTAWNGNLNNWTTDKAGTIPATTLPGAGTDVVFQANAAPGGTLTTTLEQNVKINSLTFEPSTSTPTSVTVDSGATAGNRLEIAPQSALAGITLAAGSPANVTLNVPVKLGANQTWTVTDSSATLTVNGALTGSGSLTKAGAGKVLISSAADATFTGAPVVVNGGRLETGNVGTFGTAISGNASLITVNSGGLFSYNSAAGGTVNNAFVLNGGTLTAGGNANTRYNGAISITADSTVLLNDNGTSADTGRTIYLDNTFTGSGKLIVDSVATVSSGNQLSGTLVLGETSAGNSLWSGGMQVNRGTVYFRNLTAQGTGPISANFGRFIFDRGLNGQTTLFNQTLTLDAPSGNAVLELQVNNNSASPTSNYTLDLAGQVILGGSGATPYLRIYESDTGSAVSFSGGIDLRANSHIHTSAASGSAYLNPAVVIGGVISESGGSRSLTFNGDTAWGSNNYQVIRLEGANTFTGAFILNAGQLEFKTVSNIGGAASNLGRGTAITLGSSTLRFTGDGAASSQTTDRPINTTGSPTLTANGTNGATITYAGAITQNTNNALTLTGTGEGSLTGGVTQLGTTADLNINSGTWNFGGGSWSIADDILHNAGTVNVNALVSLNDDFISTGSSSVLNLNGTGVLTANSPTGTSSGLYGRDGATINLNANDVYGAGNSGGLDFILLGDTTGATAVLNTNTFSLATPRLDVGQILTGRSATINGTGTLTVATNINTYRGEIYANLAGAATFLKQGDGTLVLAGDNTGLNGTGATRMDAGNVILDFASNNTNKLSTLAALDLRGASVTLQGSNTGASVQTVAGLTLTNGGNSSLIVNSGTGQSASFNLGAISRNAGTGTVRFVLPTTGNITTTTVNDSVTGMLGTTGGFATVQNSSGTWFARNDGNGNIVALASAVKSDLGSWTMADNITDDATGFTGTLHCTTTTINSLRFNAAGGSSLNVGAGYILNIGSGGVLLTDNVSAGSSTIVGGTLKSGTGELIFTIDSGNQALTVSSNITAGTIVTKSGTGTLALSGSNNYTGGTLLQNGTLLLSGGNAIGDSSLVTINNVPTAILDLNDSTETISGLAGGGTTGGTVRLGAGTLQILNNGASRSYAGVITGTGTLIKGGSQTQILNGDNTGFTGEVIVNQGLLQIESSTGRLAAVSKIIINGGELLADQDQSSSIDRLGDSTTVVLNNTATTRGLWFRNENQDANRADALGSIMLGAGHNVIQSDTNGGTNTARVATLTVGSLQRTGYATGLVRGQLLGASSNNRARIILSTTAAGAVGGNGAAGTTNINIIPYLIGQEGVGNASGSILAGLTGNSFVTDGGANGLRVLTAAEYMNDSATITGGTSHNMRYTLSTTITGAPTSINSLLFDSSTAITLTGPASSMEITSGAVLAANSGNHSITGFTGLTTGGGREYIFSVTNAAATLSVDPALTSAVPLVKSGAGTLVLNNAGNLFTSVYLNQGFLQISGTNTLNNAPINFDGGALRLVSGFSGDLSSLTLNLLTGGGTIDTNGVNTVASQFSINGSTGLIKAGLGTLTLAGSSPNAHTGLTTVARGVLELNKTTGVNAIGSGGLLISGDTPTVRLLASDQISDSAIVEIRHGAGTLHRFDLNNQSETIGGLVVTSTSTGGTSITTGGAGVLTVLGDIILNNNRTADTSTTEFQVLITGTGTTGTRTTTGVLDLGGVDRRIVVESNQTTTTARNDAVIETVIRNGGIIKEGSRTLYLRADNTYSGATAINNGRISITSATNLGDGSATNGIILRNGGTLRSTGASVDLGNNRTIGLFGTGGTLEVTGTNLLTVGNSIYGEDCAPLTKTGTGLLFLGSDSSYTGGTFVNEGSLIVSSFGTSATGTGAVTVASAARLGGVGYISGQVNLSAGGILSPGSVELNGTSMAGQLTIGSLTANATSQLLFQLGGPTVFDLEGVESLMANPGSFVVPASWTDYENSAMAHDQLVISGSGAPVINGVVEISSTFLDGYTPQYGDVFHILDWTTLGITSVSGTPTFNLPTVANAGWNTSLFASHGIIVVTPEPSRMLLLFFGMLVLGFGRRRRF